MLSFEVCVGVGGEGGGDHAAHPPFSFVIMGVDVSLKTSFVKVLCSLMGIGNRYSLRPSL